MMEANSREWHRFRRGKFTASQNYRLMGERGGINTETARTYILEKVAEELSDQDWIEDSSYRSQAIQWGQTLEPDAAEYYSLAFNIPIEKPNPQCPEWSDDVSGSPDGFAYPEKDSMFGIEIKCPYNPSNHVKHMLMKTAEDLKKTNKEYYWQILSYMLIFGFTYYEFVSYDPRFTGSNRMFVLGIKHDEVEDDIKKLMENLLQAVDEKKRILESLSN